MTLVAPIAGLALLVATAGAAAPPPDPAIEARVQEVAQTVRCVVCKNQSIAESDAGLAKDLVALLRERIESGDTNEEAREYLVERYGEFVLLKPRFSWRNLALWALPFVVLGLAFWGALAFIRRKGAPAPVAPLTAAEREELARLRGTAEGGRPDTAIPSRHLAD
jgi:cytochrome c-type biogenesis protein CcmH